MLAAGCDAAIRYDERLEKDMIAVPIGPRIQRFATAASPGLSSKRADELNTRATCLAMPVCAVNSPGGGGVWEFEWRR